MKTRLGACFAALMLLVGGHAFATTYYSGIYATLQKAIDVASATEGNTVSLTKSVEESVTTENLSILNLASQTLSSDAASTLTNTGSLTITTSSTGSLTNSNVSGTALVNASGAMLTLESGTFSSAYRVLNNVGKAVISGGSYTVETHSYGGGTRFPTQDYLSFRGAPLMARFPMPGH